jgi:hypothetical protein
LGGFSWHEAQLHSLPCFALKNCSPWTEEALPDWASYIFSNSALVAENVNCAKLEITKTKNTRLIIAQHLTLLSVQYASNATLNAVIEIIKAYLFDLDQKDL